MTEERWEQKLAVLQKLIGVKKVQALLAGPGGFYVTIGRMHADQIIQSVYETPTGTASLEPATDDGETARLIITVPEDKPEPDEQGMVPCSACDGSGKVKAKKRRKRRHTPTEQLGKTDVDTLWYFMKERQSIYNKRQKGEPKPWTEDEFMLKYRFTNVFREQDAGTVWMRKHLTEPGKGRPFPEILLNCAWYRLFNLVATGEFLGWRQTWDVEEMVALLTKRSEEGHSLFTTAHVVRGEAGVPKVLTVCRAIGGIWEKAEEIVQIAQDTNSLEAVFNRLTQLPSIGGFTAYEIVTDLRHTPVLCDAKDIMTWAHLGPGATRGMTRIGYDTSKPQESMQKLLVEARNALPKDFPEMEIRDIEHSLCELDKYCRIKFGEPGRLRPYDGTGK